MVERSISRKTRCMVNLQQYRLPLIIQHNIQPQYMKTHTPAIILRLRTFVLMSHQRQSRDNRFDRYIVYFSFELLNVQSLSRQLFVDTG